MIQKLQSLLRHGTTMQFIKYGLMGVSNTLLDFIVYLLLTRLTVFFGTYIFIAKALSFCVASGWSFYGNKRWTFGKSHATTRAELGKFFTIAVLSGVINVSVAYIAVRLMGLPDTTGIVLAAGATVLFGFVLNKWWVFKESPQTLST